MAITEHYTLSVDLTSQNKYTLSVKLALDDKAKGRGVGAPTTLLTRSKLTLRKGFQMNTTHKRNLHSNPTAKCAMRDAWAMVRRAQAIYGGNARQYIAEALRLAWAALNSNAVVLEFRKIRDELRAQKVDGTLAAIYRKPKRYVGYRTGLVGGGR